jgi:Glycosyltransferase like family 2
MDILMTQTSNSSRNKVGVSGDQRLLVVTPTLGVSTYLEDTVRGVISLKVPFLHVISCPRPIVQELQERFPHASVLADAGREAGLYGAINIALRAAGEDWDWFTYINDDDELAPDFSAVAQRHFTRPDPEPVVYGNVRVIDDSGQTISFLTTENSPRFIPALLRAGISPLNQQGMLFRRSVVRELGEFNPKYRICADLDFWARALAAGHRFRYYPVEVGRFRMRRGQISGDVDLTIREQDEIARRLFPNAGGALNRLVAKWRYRIRNLPRYIARSRRVGLVSSNHMLSHGGRRD